MAKTKTHNRDAQAGSRLPDPVDPPDDTDDSGWESVGEPLIDRRMTTYTLRLPRRDVERLRAVAVERGTPATALLRTWLLEALARAEQVHESDLEPVEEIVRIRADINRAMEDLERAIADAAKTRDQAPKKSGKRAAAGGNPAPRSTRKSVKRNQTGQFVRSTGRKRTAGRI